MITYKDLRIAVNRKLKTTGIEVNSEDVSEGFNRPSFFVEFLNIARSSDENQVHKSLSVQIYYFPTDRYEYAIEVLEMQETLENIFDLKLAIKDRLINVEDIDTGIVDGVLNCSFDLAFYDGREFTWNVDGTEMPFDPMEKLDIEYEKE